MKTIHSSNRHFVRAGAGSLRDINPPKAVFPLLELVIFACAFALTGALAAFILS